MSLTFSEKLLASDGTADDYFGSSIALSDNHAVVGSIGRDDNGLDSGSIYVYEKDLNGNWGESVQGQTYRYETVKLIASDSTADSQIGYNVSIYKNTIVVGAQFNPTSTVKGVVYVYEKDASGNWGKSVDGETYRTETVKLIANFGYTDNALFGDSVSIHKNHIVVGAIYGNSGNGAAYVYEKDANGNWGVEIDSVTRRENAVLYASDSAVDSQFGYSVCVHNNYIIVSAPNSNSDKGSAYVYIKDENGLWGPQNNTLTYERYKLLASDGISNDKFGNDVAINGKYAVIAARGRDDKGIGSGAIYVYKKNIIGKLGIKVDGQTYRTQSKKLLASDGTNGSILGHDIDLYNNYIIVGAWGVSIDGADSVGASYIFKTLDGGNNWIEQKILAFDKQDSDYFGTGVAITKKYAMSSSDYDDDKGTDSGSVYVYKIPLITEETKALDVNIDEEDIDTLKSGIFDISGGKATLDETRKQKIKDMLSNALNNFDKRKKRRAALKLLFSQNSTLKKMIIPKADLDLPDGFKKSKALVVKAGETFNITDLGSDEGFYSVLDNGETFNISTENTTIKFTRNDDVNNNERYDVSANDWTNIVINSDKVINGGTFSDANKSGNLAPEDSVTIDGRIFIIGSVADGGAAGSGGDPYIFPIKSNTPVKLPNKHATYRMFEQGTNYINGEVERATDEHKQRMVNYAKKITPVTHNIVMDGYFYQKAFISAEGHKLTLDYSTKKATINEESIKFFNIRQSKKHFDCGEFKEDANCWTVGWTTKENKKIQVQLMFFPNPHIENGINVIPATLKNSTGLIVDNFKPKLMELPCLTTEKFGKLHRRLNKAKNIHQKMSIKNKNEKWHFN